MRDAGKLMLDVTSNDLALMLRAKDEGNAAGARFEPLLNAFLLDLGRYGLACQANGPSSLRPRCMKCRSKARVTLWSSSPLQMSWRSGPLRTRSA